jgi:outer membrane protein TolC
MLMAQENAMSLQECIDFALANNERTKIANFDMALAESEIRETIGTGLPQIEVNAGVNYNYEVQQSLVDVSNFDPGVPAGTTAPIAFGLPYDANAVLSVRQLIFDGSFFVGLQAAKTLKELTSKESLETEIDVVEAVSKAYYTVLINEEQLALLEKNYMRLDSLLRETRALYENGFAERIDVDRVQVNFNNTKVERDRLSRFTDVSKKLLKFQMGMPLEDPIALTDALEELTLQPVVSTDIPDYQDRVEFSQLLTNEKLINLDIKNNQSQYLPKLYASLSYGGNTAALDFEQISYSGRWFSFGAVGVNLTIPIWDGSIKGKRIQQNKIQLQQLELQKSQLEKSIDLEIEQSEIDLNAALDDLKVQEENMALAQRIYNDTKIKFDEGVGSNLEVVEADADLKEAQTNYYAALYNAVVAQIELKKALGTLHNQQ